MKTLSYSLMAVMLLGALSFTSCVEETPCDLITCDNGGDCIVNEFDLAECQCLDGFEGDNCEIEVLCFNVTCPDNVTADSPLYDETDGECYCYCNDGFEGENCDQLIRDKYLGLYRADDACQSGDYDYDVEIVSSIVNEKQFIIKNFGGFDLLPADVTAEIVDVNQFNIPMHTDTDSDGDRIIEGVTWGSLNPDTGIISVQWKVTFYDNSTDECTLILTPR